MLLFYTLISILQEIDQMKQRREQSFHSLDLIDSVVVGVVVDSDSDVVVLVKVY